jgi:hypothetical protein
MPTSLVGASVETKTRIPQVPSSISLLTAGCAVVALVSSQGSGVSTMISRKEFMKAAVALPVLAFPGMARPTVYQSPRRDGLRLSTYKGDRGYTDWQFLQSQGRIIRVFLDGREIRECTLADEGLGYVEFCVTDAEGHVQVDPIKGDEILRNSAHGKVEIRVSL